MAPITPPGQGFFETNGTLKSDSFLSPSRSSVKESSNAAPETNTNSDAAIVSSPRPEIGGTYQNEILKAAREARAKAASQAPSLQSPSPTPASGTPANTPANGSPIQAQPIGNPIPIESSPPPPDRNSNRKQTGKAERERRPKERSDEITSGQDRFERSDLRDKSQRAGTRQKRQS